MLEADTLEVVTKILEEDAFVTIDCGSCGTVFSCKGEIMIF